MKEEPARTSVTWLPKGSDAASTWLSELADDDWVYLTASDESGEPYDVALRLQRTEQGRVICTALVAGNVMPWSGQPVEVTSRSLREIPIAELLGTAMASTAVPGAYGVAVSALLNALPEATFEHARPGPKGHTEEHFKKVAIFYRHALSVAPDRPLEWLAAKMGVSTSTARRHVQRARDRGMLGPAVPGKAGEQ